MSSVIAGNPKITFFQSVTETVHGSDITASAMFFLKVENIFNIAWLCSATDDASMTAIVAATAVSARFLSVAYPLGSVYITGLAFAYRYLCKTGDGGSDV